MRSRTCGHALRRPDLRGRLASPVAGAGRSRHAGAAAAHGGRCGWSSSRLRARPGRPRTPDRRPRRRAPGMLETGMSHDRVLPSRLRRRRERERQRERRHHSATSTEARASCSLVSRSLPSIRSTYQTRCGNYGAEQDRLATPTHGAHHWPAGARSDILDQPGRAALVLASPAKPFVRPEPTTPSLPRKGDGLRAFPVA